MTAQQMFKELGYVKTKEVKGVNKEIVYSLEEDEYTIFEIHFFDNDVMCSWNGCKTAFWINAKLLKAINKQMEELGWM